jgi:hypothetical protein
LAFAFFARFHRQVIHRTLEVVQRVYVFFSREISWNTIFAVLFLLHREIVFALEPVARNEKHRFDRVSRTLFYSCDVSLQTLSQLGNIEKIQCRVRKQGQTLVIAFKGIERYDLAFARGGFMFQSIDAIFTVYTDVFEQQQFTIRLTQLVSANVTCFDTICISTGLLLFQMKETAHEFVSLCSPVVISRNLILESIKQSSLDTFIGFSSEVPDVRRVHTEDIVVRAVLVQNVPDCRNATHILTQFVQRYA